MYFRRMKPCSAAVVEFIGTSNVMTGVFSAVIFCSAEGSMLTETMTFGKAFVPASLLVFVVPEVPVISSLLLASMVMCPS